MSSSFNRRAGLPEDPNDLHLWQGRQASLIRHLHILWIRFRQHALTAMLVSFLVLFCLFIWTLLYAPKRTELIAIQAAPYEWPFPPNAWAYEDIQRLSVLDGQTLTISSVPAAHGNSDLLQPFKKENVRASATSGGPVIVYISMHGVVDGNTPYLVPPDVSPGDPTQWLKLESLLEEICSAYPEQQKLVVLDCGRIQVNWNIGVLHNDFATGLRAWWENWWEEKKNDPNPIFAKLAILNSAGPGERAWSSSALQGSAFGRYFRLGLAGDADRASSVGKRDRRVTLAELHQYLQDRVNRWVWYNRADTQTPMLLNEGGDFQLAWSLNRETLASLSEQDAKAGDHAPAVPDLVLDNLWESLDDLRQARPYRYEPFAWRELEHALLSLEQFSNSGVAYRERALAVSNRLRTRMEKLKKRVDQFQQQSSVFGAHTLLSDDAIIDVPKNLLLHSLPLAEFFGSLSADVATSLRDQFAQFQESPNQKSLAETMERLDKLGASSLVQHRFLYMVRRYQFPGLWERAGGLAQLLGLRDRAEELAIPRTVNGSVGDERAHYWVRAILSVADDSRRVAEDHLLVEEPAASDAQLDEANTSYRFAADAMTKMTDAMRIRDRAWSQLAYLAQWLTDPLLMPAVQQPDEDDPGNPPVGDRLDKWKTLAKKTRELTAKLSDHTQFHDGSRAIGARIDQVKTMADEVDLLLATQFEIECRELSASMSPKSIKSGDARAIGTFRRIKAALAIPLMSADDRSTLRKRYIRLAGRLHKVFLAEESSLSAPKSMETQPNHTPLMHVYAARGDLWNPHPLWTLIEKENGKIGAEEANLKWRGRLQELFDNVALLNNVAAVDDSAPRSEWSGLEWRLRAVAPVWAPDTDSKTKASLRAADTSFFKKLRKIDYQALLLWHARRSLADFWGPAGQAAPFFDIATRDYLGSAKRLFPLRDPPVVPSLKEQLSRARVVADNWAETKATDSEVVLEAGDDANTEVVVRSRLQAEGGLPTGSAALLVRDGGKRLEGTRFDPSGAIPLPLGKTRVRVTIDGHAISTGERRLNAQTIFRGHESVGPFQVRRLGGVTVAVEPHEYEPSRVTLHSPWKKLSVVFVLDCSHSMEEEMEVGTSRLAAAKEALQVMLARFAAQRNVRIGVRFFGHRIGWSTDRPLRVMTSPSYPWDIESGLTPDQDVEQVLPLGEFGIEAARQVLGDLEAVQAWGQSPLYLALEQTLHNDFGAEDEDAYTHVIVITDGRNYQFRPTVDVNDVLQAWEQRQVPIHIVGLAMHTDQQSAAIDEFLRIAGETGGQFTNLEHSTDLCATLEKILKRDQYDLEDASGRVVDHGELGASLKDAAQGDVAMYAVRYQGLEERVLLEGGEFLEFYFRPEGSAILAFPYISDVARKLRLVSATDGSPTPFYARVHRPVRTDAGVHFSVSLPLSDPQRSTADQQVWRWTPRPREVWVEITPLLSDGKRAGQIYVFYDANYVLKKPVPLLDLVAQSWPVEATHAKVDAWFKPQETAPSLTVALSKIIGNAQEASTPLELETAGGIKIQVDAGPARHFPSIYQVRVVERHNATSAGIGAVKVSAPEGIGMRPDRIVRQFDETHGLVVHRFHYNDPEDVILERLKQAEIRIATRKAAHADTMRTGTDGVVVEISAAGDFLPLEGR